MELENPDEQTWAESVSIAHYAYILRVAAHAAPSPDLIYDVAHQAIAIFLEHPDRWKEDRDPRPILKKITKDVAVNEQRRWHWSRPEVVRRIADRLQEKFAEIDEEEWREEARWRLKRCIKELSPRSQKLLEMQLQQNRSHEEIAAMNQKSVRAVYQAFFRIRETLRRCVRRLSEGSHGFGSQPGKE